MARIAPIRTKDQLPPEHHAAFDQIVSMRGAITGPSSFLMYSPALLLQQKGAAWLASLEAGDVSAEAAIRAIVEGSRLERLASGEPGERVQQAGEVLYGEIDLTNFSYEELRRLVEVAEQRAAGAGEAEPE